GAADVCQREATDGCPSPRWRLAGQRLTIPVPRRRCVCPPPDRCGLFDRAELGECEDNLGLAMFSSSRARGGLFGMGPSQGVGARGQAGASGLGAGGYCAADGLEALDQSRLCCSAESLKRGWLLRRLAVAS